MLDILTRANAPLTALSTTWYHPTKVCPLSKSTVAARQKTIEKVKLKKRKNKLIRHLVLRQIEFETFPKGYR